LNLCHSLILAENEEKGEIQPFRWSDKGKSITEEKGKRVSYRIRTGMDFDPYTSKLHDQEAVDKYLSTYGFR